MLVLLVPASSHITDSRSITLALKKRRELFQGGGERREYLRKMRNMCFLDLSLPASLRSPCVHTLEPFHRAVAEPRVSSEQELRCHI